MKRFLLAMAMLVASHSPTHAQIDLTWDNCAIADVGEPPPLSAKAFDCSATRVYRLHGSFKTPVDLPTFFAMEMLIDLQQSTPGALVPFYHYEAGGCNATGINVRTDKSSAGQLGDGNACLQFETPWTVGCKLAACFKMAYAPDFTEPGRGRLLFAIFRSSDDPFPLEANRNYYAFHLNLSTGNRESCPGCGYAAAIVWNSATLYSNDKYVYLTGPSGKHPTYCAVIGSDEGAAPCAVTPARNVTWGRLKTIYR